MAVEHVPIEIRGGDFYHHIDMGFPNRRLTDWDQPYESVLLLRRREWGRN